MALPQTGEISFRDFNTDRGRPADSEIDMDSAAIAYGIPSKPHGMDEFRGRAVGGVTTAAPTTAPPTTAPPTTAAPIYYRIQFCDNFASGNSIAYPAGSFSVNARVSADGRTAIVTSSSTSNPGGTLLSLTSLGATGCPTTTTSTTTTTTLASVSFNLSQLGCDGANPTLRANNFTGGNNSWSYIKIGTSQANAANSSPIYIAFNESNYDFLGVYQLLNNQTYYVILADDGGRTAMRSITTAGCFATTTAAPTTAAPTTTAPPPPPTYNIFYLGYGTTSSSEACSAAQNPIYILSGDTFTTATYLYLDEGVTYAPSGYYSNSSQWRYWDASSTSITSPNNCSTGGGPEEIN